MTPGAARAELGALWHQWPAVSPQRRMATELASAINVLAARARFDSDDATFLASIVKGP